MWFDETPRLFGVADMLQKKKNKDDNYEFDDFIDVKAQALSGKYDNNCDALGCDFERAHNYNLNNIKQPENTKSDIDYSDKYSHFFNYEPSSYVRLEEDEYKPFTKSDEKANEYYIDNLQGKTLDDLIIRKMKDNAEAVELPRDVMRRQFADNLLQNDNLDMLGPPPNQFADNLLQNDDIDMLGSPPRPPRVSRSSNVASVPRLPLFSRARRSSNVPSVLINEPLLSRTSSRSADNIQHTSVQDALGRDLVNVHFDIPYDDSDKSKFDIADNEHKKRQLKGAFEGFKKNGEKKLHEMVDNVQAEQHLEKKTKEGLRKAFTHLRGLTKDSSEKRSLILSPNAKTDVASYMGGGKSEYDKEGSDIKVPRGHHPNLSSGRELHQQKVLEKKFPVVEKYKTAYFDTKKFKDDDTVSKDVLKQFNTDASPKVSILLSQTVTFKDFRKYIDAEYDRRKPVSKSNLTAESLATLETPSKKERKSKKDLQDDNSGANSPLANTMGLMAGL